MASPTASLSISFQTSIIGGSDESHLSVEVNSDDNSGKTSFIFGDSAIYRVYRSDDIANLTVVVSDGSEGAVSGMAGYIPTDPVQEAVAFANSNNASVSKYLHQLLSATRLGEMDLGSISKSGATSVQCSKKSTGELDPIIGVYQVSYRTRYDLRRLFDVFSPTGFGVNGFDSYPVVVFIIGEVV